MAFPLVLEHKKFPNPWPVDELKVIAGKYYDHEFSVADPLGNVGRFRITDHDEMRRELDHLRREHSKWRCSHPQTEIRFKLNSKGQKVVAPQCLRCGGRAGKRLLSGMWRPHEAEIIHWDYEIEVNNEAAYEEAKGPVILKHLVAAIARDADSYGRYVAYITSDPRWQARRKLVLERDNHTCQGCLVARATHVHHETYSRLFDEFMFDLISLCEPCHGRIHRVKYERDLSGPISDSEAADV